jgi:peptide/nickel transport system permease protein
MIRFLLRRLGLGVMQIAGVSVLAFALMELAPGDYLDDLRLNPQIPAETVERWRVQFGLDQNVQTRYLRWAGSVIRGDFGESLAYATPVRVVIGERVGRTIQLSSCALLFAWSAAIPLGVWCAAYPGGWGDRIAGSVASILIVLPDVVLGLLVLLLALLLNLGPLNGRLLPAALALAAISFPAVFRHARSAVTGTLALPFVDHLRACGLGEKRILFRQVLPAALNPLISLFGLSLAGLTSSSLVIEVTLGWPGLGALLLESILARDAAVVLAAVLISSLLLLGGNLAADVLLYVADPRIRWGREGSKE